MADDNLKPDETLQKIDMENRSRQYWNQILKSLNLSLDRGLQPNLIEYAGTSQNLERRSKRHKARSKAKP
jgi:hypothetical protein